MTDIQKSQHQIQLEASQHLDLAAFHLYHASQPRFSDQLPPWEAEDVKDMRVESRYLVAGALKRGDHTARKAVVERVAAVLATANGEEWPSCLNQLSPRLSDERRAVLAAIKRQKYRHDAVLVCSAVAKFYEIDVDTPEMIQRAVDDANAQRQEDAKIVAAYRETIGKADVAQMVRE